MKGFSKKINNFETLFLKTLISAIVVFFGAAVFGVLGLLFHTIKNNVSIYMYMIAFLLILLLIILFVACRLVFIYNLKNIPVHTERIKVLDKRKEVIPTDENGIGYTLYYYEIKFSNGLRETICISEKPFRPIRNPDLIAVNDTGTFLYQELEHKKYFFGFERDDGSNFYKKAYYKHVILKKKKTKKND